MKSSNLEVLRVRKVELNQDQKTYKIEVDVSVDGNIGKLTIPKINLLTMSICDTIGQEKNYDGEKGSLKITNREVKVEMLVDLDINGSPFKIEIK